MTKCKPRRPALIRLRRQAVEVDFDGGTLTSDGGLLLLREVDRRLDLIRRIDQAIPDPRDPIYTAHPQAEILTSRIFGIAAGYEDANDHQQLRHDPAFQVAAGRTPAENNYGDDQYPLASSSTHSRFENRIDSKTIFRMHEVLADTCMFFVVIRSWCRIFVQAVSGLPIMLGQSPNYWSRKSVQGGPIRRSSCVATAGLQSND